MHAPTSNSLCTLVADVWCAFLTCVQAVCTDSILPRLPRSPAAAATPVADDVESDIDRMLSGYHASSSAPSTAGAAAQPGGGGLAGLLRRLLHGGDDDSHEMPAQAAAPGAPDEEPEERYSRVLLDILHLMQRYEEGCVNKTDVMYGLFMHKLKQAIFIDNGDDVRVLKAWLEKARGMSAEDIKRLPSAYVSARVRRHVPPPLELATRLEGVYQAFKPVTIAKGTPLFRAEKPGKRGMASVHRDNLRHVLRGCVSDPPGREMYILLPSLNGAPPRYHCIRSTSQLEVRRRGCMCIFFAHMHTICATQRAYQRSTDAWCAVLALSQGYHSHINPSHDGHNISPELSDAVLLQRTHRWNISAAIKNMGATDYGFFAHWMIDELQVRALQVIYREPLRLADAQCSPFVAGCGGCGVWLHPLS
jgi:hypothetical protein